jgi:hypothetical protein
MRDLTIFAKPQKYFKRGTVSSRYPHLFRTSSLVRGEQIAQYLGCKYNPENGYEDDLCIYVKPPNLNNIKDGDFVDVVDDFYIVQFLKSRPEIGIIFCSEFHHDCFKGRIKNKVVIIPHHHCNFERFTRSRRAIKTAGIIGNKRGVDLLEDELKRRLKEIGLDLIINNDFKDRENVVDFYKQIDIQIVWKNDALLAHTPMKLTNAASFGIPTVSKDCKNFKDFDDFYIHADNTIDGLIDEVEKLKDEDYYGEWSEKVRAEAEKYHISHIAQLYRQLL